MSAAEHAHGIVPCTCKVVVKRDPRTLLSFTRIHVNQACPNHGLAPTPPKEQP